MLIFPQRQTKFLESLTPSRRRSHFKRKGRSTHMPQKMKGMVSMIVEHRVVFSFAFSMESNRNPASYESFEADIVSSSKLSPRTPDTMLMWPSDPRLALNDAFVIKISFSFFFLSVIKIQHNMLACKNNNANSTNNALEPPAAINGIATANLKLKSEIKPVKKVMVQNNDDEPHKSPDNTLANLRSNPPCGTSLCNRSSKVNEETKSPIMMDANTEYSLMPEQLESFPPFEMSFVASSTV